MNKFSCFVNMIEKSREREYENRFCKKRAHFRFARTARTSRKIYLKMLVQAVGVPVLKLAGALGLSRRGLRLLHPWKTKARAFRRGAAKAVPESRQHGARPIAD